MKHHLIHPIACVFGMLIASHAFAQQPSPLSVPIVFDNQTGLDPSQIYIQFLGGKPISGSYTNTATGLSNALSSAPSVSYSLAELQGLGAFSANNTKGVTPTFENAPGILVDSLSSGRIYINFGTAGLVNPTGAAGYTPSPELATDPNFATRWQYFETTVSNGQSWTDLSYIDFTSISFSLNATNAPGGGNTNQISSNATVLVNATLASAISGNASLPVPGATLPDPQFARVISPQYLVGSNQTVYGEFTNYLVSLNGTTSNMSGLFAGVGGKLGEASTQAQIYEYTAAFNGGANGTVTLTASANSGTGNYTGINNAIPVGKNTNGGFGVGNNTITINYSDLIANTGIYGSNPPYQVSNTTGNYTTAGIVNDVFGRVVGDLLAGLTFGLVGSSVTDSVTIGNGTTHTYNGTLGTLPSSVWWAGGQDTPGQAPNLQWVPVGDTLYPVQWLQSVAGSSNGTKLYGGAQPGGNSTINNPFYNYYAAALVGPTNNFTTPLTPGYGTPFGDRIGNNLMTFDVKQDPQGFIVLTINPDSGQGIPAGLWTGGNGTSWNTLANWSNNNGTPATSLPAGNATIQFLGTPLSSAATTVNVGGPRDAAALSFRFGAQPFTLSNGTITLNGFQQGGFFPVGANIVNSSLYAQTIQTGLIFTTNGTIAAVNGNLTLSGATQLNNSTLTNSGAQTSTFSGNVTGNGGFAQSGNGTLALTGSANSFTGGVSLSNGTLSIGASGAIGTGTLTLSGGTLASQGSGNSTLPNALVLNGNTTVAGQGSLAFNGNTTVTASNMITANAPVALNGAIGATGNNTANYTLTINGNSTLTMGGNAANTFNGSVAVTGGTLELAKTGNAPSINNSLIIGGSTASASVVLSTPGQIQLPANATSSVTINPNATLAIGSNTVNFTTTTANMTAQLILYGGNVTGNGTIATFGNTANIQFLGSGNNTATISTGLSLQNSTLSGNLSGNSTAVTVFSNDAPVQLTVSGDVTGPGALNKAGAGTLYLSGNNTYSGGTTLAAGILAASSVGDGLLVFAGGGISPGGLGQVANLTVGNATFTDGFLLFDLAAGNSSDQINVSANGTFTNTNNATVSFAFNNNGIATGNFTYTLANNFNSTGNFSYTSTNIPGLVGAFSTNGTQVIFSGASGVNATWTGNSTGTWSTGPNWLAGSVPASGADILFGNATTYLVDTVTNRTTGAITFLSSAQAYTISNNTITLGGDLTNNSTAGQTVNSTLGINWDRSFNASAGNLTLSNIDLGTTIRVNTATFNAAANRTITVSGNITDEYSVAPSIPAGNIVKTGAGTLSITGSAAHHGSTTIEEGILATAGTIGDLTQPSQTPTLVFSGGTLLATGNITTSYFNGNATTYRQPIILQETGIFDTGSNTITIDSGITGPGGITKTGNGILILTSNAIPTSLPSSISQTNYQGVLTVNQGQVLMSNNQNLGANTNTVVAGTGSLVLNNFTSTVTNNFSLSGSGAISISAANTLFTGNLSIAGNNSLSTSGGITPILSGSVATGNGSLTLNTQNAADVLTLSGPISGNGGLVKNGNGTLTLSGNNTYSGSTTVNGGTLLLNNPANVPSTAGGTWTIGNNGTLQLSIINSGSQSPFNLANNLTLSGNGSAAQGAAQGAIYNFIGFNTFSGSTTINGDTWVNITSGSLQFAGPVNIGSNTLWLSVPNGLSYIPATLSGSLSGNGTISLSGGGQLLLSGNNAGFAGLFAFQSGGSTLFAAANNALGSANQTITSGNTVALQGGITLSNQISFNGGTLLNLSGNNFVPNLSTASGPATIISNSGTLSIGGNFPNQLNIGSSTANGTVATIGPAATIGAALDVQGGYFSPGGAGTIQELTVTGGLTAGGTFVFDLAAANQSDKITSSNPYGGSPAIFFNDMFGDGGYVGNQTYSIFSANSGNFGGIPSTFTTNIVGLSGNFTGLNGNPVLFNTGAGPAAATWTGNSTNQWNTAGNWLANAVPSAGAALTFAGSQNTLVDTITNQQTGSITFAPGAAAFTLSNNTLTVGGRITNNSTSTQTIASNLTYWGSKSIVAQSGNLALSNIAIQPQVPQNLTLTFDGPANTSVSGAITQGANGTASITKNGTGTLTVSGNSTYTGATTVNSGGLFVSGSLGSTPVTIGPGASLGGGGSIGGNITFASGANFVFSNSTLSLTSPGSVVSFGNFSISNLLELPSTTGNQTFTLLASSTGLNNPLALISTTNLNNFGSNSSVSISGNRTAWFDGTPAQTGFLSNLFLNIAGGSLPPTPTQLYWVGSNGTSWFASNNWSASANATTGNASLSGNGTQSVVFSSTSANATTTAATSLGTNATVTQLTVATNQAVAIGGPGTLTINGTLATAVAVESTAGNVTITTPVVLAGNSTTISVNGTSPSVAISTIGGSNGLVKAGNGTLTLTGVSTYTGGTTVSGGTLALNASSITGNVTNNAALAFNQTTNGTFSGNISGNGSVAKSGNATLTLDGTNTHSGLTTVSSGTLVSGNLTNSTLVLQDGAVFSPGPINAINTIAVSGLTLNGGDLLYNLGNATSDRINASGTAALNGPVVFDFANLGYTAGNFTLLTGTGVSAFITSNLHFNTAGNFTLSGNFVVSGNALLFVAAAPPPGNFTWTGGNGTGNWNAPENWAANAVPPSNAPVFFAGSNQTAVDTNANQSVGGIVFNAGASAFTLSNNTLTLSGNVENDSSNTQTINSAISLATNTTFAADSGGLVFGGPVAFGANATLLVADGANATAISGNITGNGSLLKRGTGNLTLSGTNTFTGNTTINAGNLIAQGGSALLDTATVTIAGPNATFTLGTSETVGSLQGIGTASLGANQTLTVAQAGSATFNGTLTGGGGFEKSGAGTLTLAGTSLHTGGTTVSWGTLIGTSASLQGSISNNATLAFNQSASGNYSGTLSGTGIFQKTGSGTLTLSGSTTQGQYAIQQGVLAVSTGTALGGGDTTVSNGAQLNVTSPALTLGNLTIAGSGVAGNGSLVLSNSATLNATLTLSANSTIGAADGSLNGSITGSNTTLTLNSSSGSSGEISGNISLGSGGIVKTGGGFFGLAGNNTYTGGVNIASGTLGAHFESLKGDISNNGTLIFQSLSANDTYTNTISGNGSVAINSTGNLTLTANNTYTGNTTVNNGGTLLVSGSLASGAVSVASGSAVGGNGTLGGSLSFAAGSNLIYNASSALTVNGSSISFGGFSLANLAGFNGSNATQGNSLLLGGTADVNTANLSNLGWANAQTFGSNEVYFFTGAGGKNLNLAVAAAVSDIYWVGDKGTDWFAANNWSTNATASVGDATFSVSTQDIHFASTSANATSLSSTDLSANATVRNLIVSTSQNVGVGGNGTLTLNGTAGSGIHLTSTAGNVTFTAPITVSGGAGILIDGGQLEVASLQGTGVGIVTAANTTFAYNTASNLSFNGTISGAGNFAKRGNGTLTLTTANAYAGNTAIQAGIVNIQNAGALGSSSGGTSVSAGAALELQGGIAMGAEPLTLNGSGISGNGSLRSVSGNNSYAGAITLGSASEIQADAGSLSLTGVISTAGSLLTVDALAPVSLSGIVSGSGGLTKNGAATLTITGNNTFTGATTINAGAVEVGTGGTSGNLAGPIVNNGSLNFNRTDAFAVGGAISGTSGFTMNGTGSLILSGANSYAGQTVVNAGVVNIQSSTALGSTAAGTTVAAGAALELQNNVSVGAEALTMTGSGIAGNGALRNVSGSNTYGGAITMVAASEMQADAGILNITNTISNGGFLLTVDASAGAVNVAAPIVGAGGLNKIGANTLVLSGTNTYSGPTTLTAGTLASGSLPNSNVILAGGNFSPGGAGAIQSISVNGLALNGGGLIFDLGAGVSDQITIGAGAASLTSATSFFFNDAGFVNGTFTLLSGDSVASLNIGLLGFTSNIAGLSGRFAIVNGQLIFRASSSAPVTGPVLENSPPVNTPTTANFLVQGPVRTGSLTQNNIVNSLTFASGSSLEIFNILTVTSGAFDVQAGTPVSVNGGTVVTPGAFNKNGPGTLITTSTFQVGGAGSINAGALYVNGTFIVPGGLTVAPNALLGGNGTIFGNLANNGTVGPGNSPGTLTVAGNFAQSGSGSFQMEIASLSSFDTLIATGQASLAGTLNVIPFAGFTLEFGQQFPGFIQAGSVTGTFDNISIPDGFRGRILQNGGSLTLLVAPESYTQLAQNQNQFNVARALDSFISEIGNDQARVSTALDLMQASQYPGAFNAIMPGFYESLADITIQQAFIQGQQLNQRFSSLRLGAAGFQTFGIPVEPLTNDKNGRSSKEPVSPIVPNPNALNWSLWTMGTGIFSKVASISQVPNYRSESGGILVGADYRWSENFTSGLYGGYQATFAEYGGGGSTQINTALFGGYVSYADEGFYADAFLGGGYSNYNVRRPITFGSIDRTADSQPDGGQLNAGLNLGYDWEVGGFTFGPILGAQYSYVGIASFTETGAGSLNLQVAQQNANSFQTTLGARVAYTWKVSPSFLLIPEVRLFWQHEFLNNSRNIGASLNGGNGAGFDFATSAPDRDSIFAGAGITAQMGERWNVSLFYNADFGGQEEITQAISVSAGWSF